MTIDEQLTCPSCGHVTHRPEAPGPYRCSECNKTFKATSIDKQLARILELAKAEFSFLGLEWLSRDQEFREFVPKAARVAQIAIAAFRDIANVDYEELDSIAVKTAKTALAAITKELES